MLLAQSNTISEGEHRLQSPYCLWYSKKTNAQSFDQVKFLKKIISEHIQKIVQLFFEILNLMIFYFYLQKLQLLGSFATCEQFWKIYALLIRPGELTSHSDFHLFKKGIKPLWEVSNF